VERKTNMTNYSGMIIRFNREGRIVRGKWVAAGPGLLGVVGLRDGASRNCPPAWLVYLVPGFSNKGTLAAWPAMVDRFATLAPRWYKLNGAAWRRCLLLTLRVSLEIAQPHDKSNVVAMVMTLIDRELAGDAPSDSEWARAAGAAEAAAKAAAETAAWDKITNACFTAIERECDLAEAA
jgi:hypothetical protein